MQDLLEKNEIMSTLKKYYVWKGGAQLKKNANENSEPLEYHGAQYNLAVFVLRVKPL
jgi:hypothetical protein